MNSDPSLCRLIANPHRLKKNEIKVTIVRDKGKDKIKEYLREEYKHLYISHNLISDLDNLIKDYLADYEISLICEEMIQRIITRSKKYRTLEPEIIAFDNASNDSDKDEGPDKEPEKDKRQANRSIFDMMIQDIAIDDGDDDIDDSDDISDDLDEEISDILDEYLSDEYLSDQLSDELNLKE